MATKPNKNTSKAEDEVSSSAITPPEKPKRDIYPEVNDRIKGAIMWLGLVFVATVIWVQYFSGYS